jgi:cobalt-zinc-cadmium efflux system outer membrane protein
MSEALRQHRWLIAIALGFIPIAAHAEVLTRARVIELGRTRAPSVRVAETRIVESRGRLVGARVLLPENPALEVDAGPSWGTQRTTDLDLDATLTTPIPLGGRRNKRIASAEAGIDRDTQLARDARRNAVGDALAAYYQMLHAKARIELAQTRKMLADDLLQTATERKKAGDVAQLEVNVAAAEVARADSEILAEQANLSRARAQLAIALGLPSADAIDVGGRLDDRAPFDALANGRASERPDVAAARAEVTGSVSDIALADAARFPDVSFRVGYKRDIEGDAVLAGFAISLPFFERGQGVRAEARARRDRAVVELDARQSAAAVEVEAARTTYRTAVEAMKGLDERGLRLAIQNEDMARQSYRAGKIDLPTLLLVRREALDTRREYLQRQLEAALAGVELTSAIGEVP